MPDYSVQVKVINKTKQTFHLKEKKANYGEWKGVPDQIPGGGSASFEISDSWGWYGADGSFSYYPSSHEKNCLSAYQACPWGWADNAVSEDPPGPSAVYNVAWRSYAGDGPWRYKAVDKDGHPLHVEYTIAYEQKRYKFRLVQITASSSHPIWNSRGELVYRRHTLWDAGDPSAQDDSKKGSLQPNVFAYDFQSSLADNSFNVTIQPLDLELIGAEVILSGYIQNRHVFTSDYFFLKNLKKVETSVHTIDPTKSSAPIAHNADVTWKLEIRLTGVAVDCLGPSTTRVELYWIAQTIHSAFRNGIPIAVLRTFIPGGSFIPGSLRDDVELAAAIDANNNNWYQQETTQIFSHLNKVYDTAAGASSCNVHWQGGIFDVNRYLAADITDNVGTLSPSINCMDQAAMLQLACSLYTGNVPLTSWLLQAPFGFINDTHLVGVTDNDSQYLAVNNPFFGTDQSRAHVDVNDPDRTRFGCHVFLGNSNPYVAATDGIYDACAGPHTGTEVGTEYDAVVIDNATSLHKPPTGPIAQQIGVTGIDGHWPPGAALSSHAMELLGERLANIVTLGTMPNPPNLLSHVHWGNLPGWIEEAFDDRWRTAYAKVSVAHSASHAFWDLRRVEEPHGAPLRVSVYVEAAVSEDGTFDMDRAASEARRRLSVILASTDRDAEELWVPSNFEEVGQQSLQYADHVGVGRVVILSGNMVVDITGEASTEALKPYIRKLIARQDDGERPTLRTPIVHYIQTPEAGLGEATEATVRSSTSTEVAISGSTSVFGVESTFSLRFETDRPIIAANAVVEGPGILVNKYKTEQVEGRRTAVTYSFMPTALGSHQIHVHFADAETLIAASTKVDVEVLEGRPSETD